MLDILIIAIVALFLLYGIRTGLARMALRLCSALLSVVLAWMLLPILSAFLSGLWAQELADLIQVNYVGPNLEQFLGGGEGLPAFLSGILALGGNTAVQSAEEALSGGIAALLINIASFLLLFLLCRLALSLLARLLELAARLPLIKQCNKLGGAVLGALEGVLTVYLLLALVLLTAPVRDSELFRSQLRTSPLTQHMYQENFIIKLAAPKMPAGTTIEGGAENDQRVTTN